MINIQQQVLQAETLIKANKKMAAQAILQGLLSQKMEAADDLYATSIIAFNLSLFSPAVELLKKAISKDSSKAHYYTTCGMALSRAYQYSQAEQYMLKALQMEPRNTDYLSNLGDLYQNSGNYSAAKKTFMKVLKINPYAVVALYGLAYLYERNFDNKKAKQYARRALRVAPDHAPSHFILCQIWRREKRFQEAVTELEKLLTLHPNYVSAHYELGHVFQTQKKYPEAYKAFEHANTLQDPGYLNAKQIDKEFRFFEKVIQDIIVSTPTSNASALTLSKAEAPVFIVGSPRSGTTLLSSMLGQHAQLHAAGELSYIYDLYALVNQKIGQPDDEGKIAAHIWGKESEVFTAPLVEAYRELLQQVSNKQGTRVIDKTPFNVQRFPMIAKVSPESPIIHIIRDGREVSWSNYTQNYSQYHWHAHSLSNGIKTWQRNIIIARQCAAKFDLNYIEVRYEDLVQKPEATLKILLEHLALPWQASCLTDYKKSSAPVLTASYEQVKQNLYTSALQKAQNYPSAYASMTPLAGDMLDELGYL